MLTRRILPAFFATVVLFFVASCAVIPTAWGITFEGQVVDGETAEPLEGAVVTIIWWRYAATLHGRPVVANKVVESLTSARGAFSADVLPGLPLGFAKREVIVFKPGYHVLHTRTIEMSSAVFPDRILRLA